MRHRVESISPMVVTPEPPKLTGGYALYCDFRKTMDIFSAAIMAFKISRGANKLVLGTPTKEQTLEAVLIYRAYREARELTSLRQGIDHLTRRLEELKTQYALCFSRGFKQDLVDLHAEKL